MVSVNGVQVGYFDELRAQFDGMCAQKVQQANLQVLRGADTLTFERNLSAACLLGIPIKRPDIVYKKYNLLQAVVPGAAAAFGSVFANLQGMGKMFRGEVDARKALAGPVRIGSYYQSAFDKVGWYGFWQLTGLLSMWLAFVNILPIPALDGGHLMLLTYEAITRRTPSLKVLMRIQQVGMAILLSLMLLIIFNDAFSLLF